MPYRRRKSPEGIRPHRSDSSQQAPSKLGAVHLPRYGRADVVLSRWRLLELEYDGELHEARLEFQWGIADIFAQFYTTRLDDLSRSASITTRITRDVSD